MPSDSLPIIEKPMLNWLIARTHYGGNFQRPAGYYAYLVLWDGLTREGQWFRENSGHIVNNIVSEGSFSLVPDIQIMHELYFEHEWSPKPGRALSDEQVIEKAKELINNPVDFALDWKEWKSVQQETDLETNTVVYQLLHVSKVSEEYVQLTTADLYRFLDEAYKNPNDLPVGEYRSNDEHFICTVQKEPFEKAYRTAMG